MGAKYPLQANQMALMYNTIHRNERSVHKVRGCGRPSDANAFPVFSNSEMLLNSHMLCYSNYLVTL